MQTNIIRRSAAVVTLSCVGTLGLAGHQPAEASDICYTFTSAHAIEVKYGDRDSSAEVREVSWWQCHLKAIGYDDVFDDGHGVFGKETHKAVVNWQRKHPSIKRTDGLIEARTMNSIRAACPIDF
ncbi:peptidoglycan-binding domain-containing protein [Demetria terragena]|uniref:peptidoglycan-binding domain-containing protein n=1 Tax=Demetria terragena TaxID=63959 RepID=UPI0003783F1B|nr:peptidoglycan-binding domain-containing protein [Demetria terragena]